MAANALLYTLQAIVVIAVALVVGLAAWWGFVLYRRLLAPATRTAENLATLTNTAREENLPRKVSLLADELQEAAHEIAGASAALRRFLENEQLSALPADFRETVGKLQDAVERFSATLSRVDQYLRVPEEAKRKVDLFKDVLSALSGGIVAGWKEWHHRKESEES